MSALFHCVVPGKPVPQSRPKIVRATGRVYYGKHATAQRELLYRAFFFNRLHTRAAAIDTPCRVTIEAAGAHGNSDLDNIAKLVLDSLVDCKVLATDRASVVRELVVRVVDGEPRTIVTITAIPIAERTQIADACG